MEKKVTTPVVIGLVISLILIVLAIVGYIAGIDQQSWYKWISVLIFCGGIIYACSNFGKQSDGNVTFGNVFAYGFKSSAVVTCIMIVFIIIFVSVFPEIKDKAMDEARKKMDQQQGVSQEQVDAGLAMMKKSFLVIAILASLFIYLVAGVISALIGAAVTKKNPQTPFQNQP